MQTSLQQMLVFHASLRESVYFIVNKLFTEHLSEHYHAFKVQRLWVEWTCKSQQLEVQQANF